MIYKLEAACCSNIGKVRANNEDNFFFNGIVLPQENNGQVEPLLIDKILTAPECLAVFDGMGGGDCGEVASYTAANLLKQILSHGPIEGDMSIQSFLTGVCGSLNNAVCTKQAELDTHRMGSTAAILSFSNGYITACNIGDSRIFGLRADRFIQISTDHTDEAFLKERGITGRRPGLTQYLGLNPETVRLDPYIAHDELQPGDRYIICSDGLTDMLENDEIASILKVSATAEDCVKMLVQTALDNGGRDNVTVIVCYISGETMQRGKENGIEFITSGLERLEAGAKAGWRHIRNCLRDRT